MPISKVDALLRDIHRQRAHDFDCRRRSSLKPQHQRSTRCPPVLSKSQNALTHARNLRGPLRNPPCVSSLVSAHGDAAQGAIVVRWAPPLISRRDVLCPPGSDRDTVGSAREISCVRHGVCRSQRPLESCGVRAPFPSGWRTDVIASMYLPAIGIPRRSVLIPPTGRHVTEIHDYCGAV